MQSNGLTCISSFNINITNINLSFIQQREYSKYIAFLSHLETI